MAPGKSWARKRGTEPMSYAAIHPDWEKPRRNMVDGYSLEMTARELDGLREAAPLIRPQTQIAITFLPGEEMAQRVEAAKLVRELGFEPIVHLSARRIGSKDVLEDYLARISGEAAVKRAFLIAGDPPEHEGPYEDSMQVIETGLLEKHGVTFIGVGVPGPAGIKRLLGFAKRCGVGASASVMKKYGISLTNLIGTAGPDKLVNSLDAKLNEEEHGRVRLHFYPFGALTPAAEWINQYDARHP